MYLVQISIASSSKNFNFITLRKYLNFFFFTDNDKNKMKNKIHMYVSTFVICKSLFVSSVKNKRKVHIKKYAENSFSLTR